ncbi:MAG: hypothetical protein QOF77_237 [Solirubrobacteraceae bacterium]|jgi:hypothetical protein|nr:hypothetical protein [Solirubrobacteraceae bacterium]
MTDDSTTGVALAEKVKGQISPRDTPDRRLLLDALHSHPAGATLSEFELDLRDWGMLVGLGHGIARSEDPFESLESVAARALAAATLVHEEAGREVVRPAAPAEEIVRIRRAYDRFRQVVGSTGARAAELDEAIETLDSAIREASGRPGTGRPGSGEDPTRRR